MSRTAGSLKFITNADDLGESRSINRAIFDLMAEGLVTSATILANAPATEEACRESANYGNRSFGAHLNLTQFDPLTGNAGVGALMRTGRGDGSAREWKTLAALRRPIFQEWCAQVERIQSFGIAVSHLDSHHHVHTIPTLLPAVKAVQQRYAIRKVRISKNLYTRRERPGALLRFKKTLFNAVLRTWHKTLTTDVFTDLAGFQENRDLIERRQWSVEIMLHPGGENSEAESRQLRNPALSDPRIRQSLVSYEAL
jgi:predicted glycoside hydrolase/deacetylase ChbG (UPF0249 family)